MKVVKEPNNWLRRERIGGASSVKVLAVGRASYKGDDNDYYDDVDDDDDACNYSLIVYYFVNTAPQFENRLFHTKLISKFSQKTPA